MHLGIRFHNTQQLPKAGDTVLGVGMAGTYAISIERIKTIRPHPTEPFIIIEVEGRRELISSAFLEEDRIGQEHKSN